MLYKNHFPGGHAANTIFYFIFVTMEYFVRPFNWFGSHFLSLFIPTTLELERPYFVLVKFVFLMVPYLVACALLFPFLLIGVLVRMPLQQLRAPYVYSEEWTQYTKTKYKSRRACEEYTILTANLCLLPEFLARMNNLSRSATRATEIGQRIIVDQLLHDPNHSEAADLPRQLIRLLERHRIQYQRIFNFSYNNSNKRKGKIKGFQPRPAPISSVNSTFLVSGISSHFSQLDFLCFQECWSTRLTKRLVRELHQLYPYIIYDVGAYNYDINFYALNSGLMFASKYSIVDVHFEPFTDDMTNGVFDSKGLLMVKLQISKQCIGYIFVTHLEAYEVKLRYRQDQMDSIMEWMHDFKESNREVHDVILFDILCGDFNFDNMSPCDRGCQYHDMFDKYDDIARDRAGEDKVWSIGTVLRQYSLHDPEVSNPEAMQRTFQNPLKRQHYLIDASLEKGTFREIRYQQPRVDFRGKPTITHTGGKRRTSCILCRKNIPLIIENYNFITRLAALTDNIPISMAFKVHA